MALRDQLNTNYLIGALAAAALAATLFVSFLIICNFPEGTISPDGKGYINITEYFMGRDVELNKFRVSRPLVPILAIPLTYIVEPKISYLVVNALLFILLTGLFYVMATLLLKDDTQALYATALLLFAFPVYYRGINVTVDMASWVLFVLVGSIVLDADNSGKLTPRTFFVLSFFCGVGTLITEMVLVSFLFILFFYAFSRLQRESWSRFFYSLFLICASFSVPVLVIQAGVYWLFDYTIFDKAIKVRELSANAPLTLGPVGFMRALVGAFSVSLFFAVFGLVEFFKKQDNVVAFSALLLAGLITFSAVWTSVTRFVFVLSPLVFTCCIRGIIVLSGMLQGVLRYNDTVKKTLHIAAVVFIIIINVLMYCVFLRFGTTLAMAKKFLLFLF